ncbi:MurR/RpiR family transcriptional regulator [Lachnospiraceae bacterium LCP25S3_G4]
MAHFEEDIIVQIQNVYKELTSVEKNIADFFIKNKEMMDFSTKNIAKILFLSEATLSRFAKKCGYKGFREFAYNYERRFRSSGKTNINELTKKVIITYQELLDKSLELVNENQMSRIAQMLSESNRVCVYGMGSSGIVAKEFKIRFMRLGVHVEAEDNAHMMKMTSALATEGTLIIAFTLSGKTNEILDAIEIAKKRGAKVILVTSSTSGRMQERYDEVLSVASIDQLELGTTISPQFPILVMVDIFYIYFLNTDYYVKSAQHMETLSALFGDNI